MCPPDCYCGHMVQMGVRELKSSLSRTLRAVSRGEQVRVTVRGRPVADIVPAAAAGADDRLRELVAGGRLVPPTRARPESLPRLARSRVPASSLVLAERDAER
jgi:prevent-host-death family protein